MGQTTWSRASNILSMYPINGFACLIGTRMGAVVSLSTHFVSEVGQNSASGTTAKKNWSAIHQPMGQTTWSRPSNILSMDPNNGFACLIGTRMGAVVSMSTHFVPEMGQNSAFCRIAKKIGLAIHQPMSQITSSRPPSSSLWIQTMDLHALHAHEWELWWLWALILAQRWAKIQHFAEEQRKLLQPSINPWAKSHHPDHPSSSLWIQTMDLHALHAHEWVLWWLWALILAQRWAKIQHFAEER